MNTETGSENKNANLQMGGSSNNNAVQLPDGVDPELLVKVLANPEMAALLQALAKNISKQGKY